MLKGQLFIAARASMRISLFLQLLPALKMVKGCQLFAGLAIIFRHRGTPRRRCGAVSSKFQRFYDHGILRYITADTLKGQPVLCATPSPGIGCTSDTVLFTLKPGSNPHATLRRLLDRRGLAGGMVLNESSNSVDIDFERYLESGSDEAKR